MQRTFLVRVVLAAALLVPATLAVAPGAARACGSMLYLAHRNELRIPARPSSSELIAQAEQALSEGKQVQAAATALQAYPALKIVKVGTLPLADRALRIVALAAVRSDGGLSTGSFTSKSAADRAANLEWSVEVLRGLDARRANNPTYQTDLGEALARVPAHREEAAKLLGDLADRDLLTSAEGYAALARLRAESGDQGARDALVKRCEVMTKTPAVCRVPAATSGAGQT